MTSKVDIVAQCEVQPASNHLPLIYDSLEASKWDHVLLLAQCCSNQLQSILHILPKTHLLKAACLY